MSQGETPVTIVGNIVNDPEVRRTPAGVAVANFRVASTPRRFDKTTNDWVDGEGLFLTCNVWRDQAEHVAESLSKGMRVIVTGNLRQRSYENREGQQRSVYEIEVHDVGPSLKWATGRVERSRGGSGGSAQGTPPQAAYDANSNPYGNTGGGDPFGAPF